jgi:hypothetical protein
MFPEGGASVVSSSLAREKGAVDVGVRGVPTCGESNGTNEKTG